MEQGSIMEVYYKEVTGIIEAIHREEKQRILAAARRVADQVMQDKIVYIWGPGGHSNLGAMEIFFRAGGLMHVSAILNTETMMSVGALKSMQVERLPGYGKIVVNDYGIGQDDLLIIVNAYGINSATIDGALTAKENGAALISVSSFEHARECPPDHIARHPSKRNLHEIADFPIDCKVKVGDAVVAIDGVEQKVGALSTFANAYVLNCMVIEAIAMMASQGFDPPIWKSGNAPGGDAWNQPLFARLRSRVRLL